MQDFRMEDKIIFFSSQTGNGFQQKWFWYLGFVLEKQYFFHQLRGYCD